MEVSAIQFGQRHDAQVWRRTHILLTGLDNSRHVVHTQTSSVEEPKGLAARPVASIAKGNCLWHKGGELPSETVVNVAAPWPRVPAIGPPRALRCRTN